MSRTVQWNNKAHGNSKSTTTWCGQRFSPSTNEKKIVTTWLLVRETTPADSWSSTRVGKDTFTKIE